MRVLHVVHRFWPGVGGTERYIQDLGEGLSASGHHVEVWTTDAQDPELFSLPGRARFQSRTAEHNGVSIRRFPVRHWPLHRLSAPLIGRFPLRLAALALRPPSPLLPELHLAEPINDVDVVHATALPYSSLLLAARNVARRTSARLLMTPHLHLGEGGVSRLSRHYMRPEQIWLLNQADAVIARTKPEAAALVGAGVSPERVHVIGCWVDPAQGLGGSGTRFRETFPVSDAPIVCSVGTRSFDKGTVHLVQAMERLWHSGSSSQLVLAGSSTAGFERFFASQSALVRSRTTLLDGISDAAKWDLYKAATIVAMPSRVDSFGIVFLESWLFGLPVIGAMAGGIPAVIEHGVDGLLPAFGDVSGLSQAIAKLLESDTLRRSLGSAGQAKVHKQYTKDRLLPRVMALYSDALGR